MQFSVTNNHYHEVHSKNVTLFYLTCYVVVCVEVPVVKNLPADARDIGDRGLIPGLGRSHGGGMATHSGILAWRIPCTEEPGGVRSIGSYRVGQD